MSTSPVQATISPPGNNWSDGRYNALFTAAARTSKLGGEAK